jgi:hypothetical protein
VGPRAGLDEVEQIVDPTGTRTPIPWSSSPYSLAVPAQNCSYWLLYVALETKRCHSYPQSTFATKNYTRKAYKMIYGIKILRYCQVGKLYKAKKNKYN